jgi:hypothetical protein
LEQSALLALVFGAASGALAAITFALLAAAVKWNTLDLRHRLFWGRAGGAIVALVVFLVLDQIPGFRPLMRTAPFSLAALIAWAACLYLGFRILGLRWSQAPPNYRLERP